MATYAVVFLPGTPQDIADRTAATLRLIEPCGRGPEAAADNFFALLARGARCCCCPTVRCAMKSASCGALVPTAPPQMGVPHNLEAANRILQLRKELLGAESVGGAP